LDLHRLSTALDEFRDLDRARDTELLLAEQLAFRELEPIASAKRLSYELMETATGARVLDVGCGPGRDVRALAARVAPNGEAVGVDRSEAALDFARRENSHPCASYVTGLADRLPFASESFASVRSERCLQYADMPLQMVREMARVTRRGAPVVLVTARAFLKAGEGLDPKVTQPRLERAIPTNPLVWEFLPLLVARAGLEGIQLHHDRALLKTWEEATAALSLRLVTAWAGDAGSADQSSIRDWIERCQEAFERSAVAIGLQTLVVVARSPESSRDIS